MGRRQAARAAGRQGLARSAPDGRTATLCLLLQGFIALLYTLYYFAFGEITRGETEIGEGMVAAMNLLCVLCWLWSVAAWLLTSRRFFSLYTLFLLYAFLSNAGQTLLEVFGYSEHWFNDIYAEFSYSELVTMLSFCALCGLYMNLGALLAWRWQAAKPPARERPGQAAFLREAMPYMKGLYYLLLLVVFAEVLDSMRFRLTASYADYMSVESSGIFGIFWFAFNVMVLAMLLARPERAARRPILLALAAVNAMWLFIGARNRLIASIGMFFFLMEVGRPGDGAGRRLRPRQAVLLGAAGLLVLMLFSLVARVRDLGISSMSLDDILASMNPLQSLIDAISEMGATAKTVLKTLRYLPQVGHQQTIAYSTLKSFLPNFILSAVGVRAPAIGSLSRWVSAVGMPPGSTINGLGYSFIAEAYINYGRLGFLFTGVYGFLIVALELSAVRRARAGRVLFPAIVAYILSKQIFFARGQLELVVSTVRYALMMAAASLALSKVYADYVHLPLFGGTQKRGIALEDQDPVRPAQPGPRRRRARAVEPAAPDEPGRL